MWPPWHLKSFPIPKKPKYLGVYIHFFSISFVKKADHQLNVELVKAIFSKLFVIWKSKNSFLFSLNTTKSYSSKNLRYFFKLQSSVGDLKGHIRKYKSHVYHIDKDINIYIIMLNI